MSSTSDGNECRQLGTIDSTGLSADKLFFLCVMRGSDKKVAAIIEQSIVKPNIQGPDGKTALHISAAAGHHLVEQVLLEAGCDESIADSDGWTAIRYALENGHRSVLNVLVQQQPASINQRVDPMQHTIIHLAATLEVALRSPVSEAADKAALVPIFLEARQSQELGTERVTAIEEQNSRLDFEDAVRFLSMDSIYHLGSAENVFAAAT